MMLYSNNTIKRRKAYAKNINGVYYSPSYNSFNNSINRQYRHNIAMNRKSRVDNSLVDVITLFIAIVGAIIAIVYIGGRAIDISIDNQNMMLCNSAKVSGNEKYLSKCQEYYRSNDIEYMRHEN